MIRIGCGRESITSGIDFDGFGPEEVFRILEEDLEDFDRFIAAIVQRYFKGDEGA